MEIVVFAEGRGDNRMRLVDKASTSTLFATCAATKSAATEKANCTRSTSNIGREELGESIKLLGAT